MLLFGLIVIVAVLDLAAIGIGLPGIETISRKGKGNSTAFRIGAAREPKAVTYDDGGALVDEFDELAVDIFVFDGALLVACPCDIRAWREGRTAWPRSESPIQWVDRVERSARVIALTGSRDDNTLPQLAEAYVVGPAKPPEPA